MKKKILSLVLAMTMMGSLLTETARKQQILR